MRKLSFFFALGILFTYNLTFAQSNQKLPNDFKKLLKRANMTLDLPEGLIASKIIK